MEIRGLIRSVLHELVDDDVPHAHVVRLISEGRTSATVFEVSLRRGQEDQRWVVKIGPPNEMAREFFAYQKLVEPRRPVTCAPIVKEIGNAVAYQHVASFAGLLSEPTPTLEEVVRQAYQGDEEALKRVLRVISTLFIRLGGAFYDRRTTTDTASLRQFNPRLGPDLVLTATLQKHPLTSREVVFETTVGGDLLQPGSVIELDRASGDGVTVVGMADWRPEGVIENVRYDDRHTLLADAVDPATPSADPSSALRKVLTDTRFGRMKCVGHGDLNPRNVLLVGDETYVIDFAETADGLPLLWDPAWLEVGLMRDVFADLPHADLLRLQRLLAVACRMRSLAQQPDDVEEACLRLVPDNLAVPFKVLFTLRCQALALHRGDDAWENYLALLYFSGYRTLKWKDHNDTVRVRAVHSVLAVCSEWLVDDTPFQHWAGTDEILSVIAPLLDLTKSQAVKLAAGLTTGKEPPSFARDLGSRLAVQLFRQQANDRHVDLELSHEEYIHLVVRRDRSYLDPITALSRARESILVGEAGSGKTSLINELNYRLCRSVSRAGRSDHPRLPLRMPIERSDLPAVSSELLKLGAVHVLVDDATEEDLQWALDFRSDHPHTPVLLAMREAPEESGWPVFRLEPISDEQAVDYVTRMAMSHRLQPTARARLVDLIANSKSPIRSPALLRMAIDHVKRLGDLRSVDEVLGEFFGKGYGADHQARPLIAESVFLSAASDEELAACARSFIRRESCLLAARLRETPERVVEQLVRTVWTDDPEYAAELLAAAVKPPAGLTDELTTALEAVLADATAGSFHHRSAANALGVLGADKQLTEALLAHNGAPEVLDTMRTLWWHGTTPDERPARRRVFCDAFDCILTGHHPNAVLVAVLELIAAIQFTGLELVIADLIPDSPAALEAAETLMHLGVARPTRMRVAHYDLLQARLAELEQRLPTLSNLREIQAVEAERDDRRVALGLSTFTEHPDRSRALRMWEVFQQDHMRGMRMLWSATTEQRWPWVGLLYQMCGSSSDLSALIESDAEGRECAVRALAFCDYHRTAALRPRIKLTAAAEEILAQQQDTDGAEWALAVAAAGLPGTLPHLLDLIDDITGAAIGLLARGTAEASRVHELLREHNALIGLAYLGDWVPLLTSSDEPTVLAAGANAVKRWAPEPAGDIALWLDNALRTHDLTPERRSLFAELKRHMEKKDGKLVSRL
ncbi:hypothetical protein ABZ345_08395 [Lentzea sp. NPDC005914]|uniref:hypothetical protein n=1 Tax=Lentzea sp. NPDC005914 TaxID=3154572 RepID=UPI0033EC83C8